LPKYLAKAQVSVGGSLASQGQLRVLGYFSNTIAPQGSARVDKSPTGLGEGGQEPCRVG